MRRFTFLYIILSLCLLLSIVGCQLSPFPDDTVTDDQNSQSIVFDAVDTNPPFSTDIDDFFENIYTGNGEATVVPLVKSDDFKFRSVEQYDHIFIYNYDYLPKYDILSSVDTVIYVQRNTTFAEYVDKYSLESVDGVAFDEHGREWVLNIENMAVCVQFYEIDLSREEIDQIYEWFDFEVRNIEN